MPLSEDIRFGLRSMAKNRGATAVAIVALALGIGANATVFAIANTVLFTGDPFVSDRILYLSTRNPNRVADVTGVSYPDFRDWRAQTKAFEALGAYQFDIVNVSDKIGAPTRYNLARITANTLTLIGQKPVIGREFSEADATTGAPPVAILGHGVWQDRYGSNPAILGQVIRINQVPTTIIGVMRRDFRFPTATDIWTPLIPGADAEKRDARDYNAFGLLANGSSIAAARADMETIARNLQRAYPATNQGVSAVVHNYNEEFTGPEVNLMVGALFGAVTFVLLIACANVANLLLGRAADRAREISIRIALGAGRWRIIRQLLVESVLLGCAGGCLGWIFSIWGLRLFDLTVRGQVPAWMVFKMEYRGFAYLALISVGSGLVFGLAPALRLSKLDVNSALKDGTRGSTASRGNYLSRVLVVSEMALAVVLLVGAGLTIRSFLNIHATKTGVNVKNMLVMRLFLPEAKYPRPDDQISFHKLVKTRLESLPGVELATIAMFMPTGGSLRYPFELEHAAPVAAEKRPALAAIVIGLDYFRTMDVNPIRGRVFDERDGAPGSQAGIVNQRFAEKYFPGDEPIGKRLRIFDEGKPEPWMTIVGVVPNILQNDVATHDDPLIYLPFRQRPTRDMALMARARVPPGTLATAFRKEVQALDEDMPLYNVRTLEERLALNYWGDKIFGSLFAIFASIALLLAAVGLYAVIAQSVSQRTQEIGVRMALGASAPNILRLVFFQGIRQLAIGLGLGILAAVALTRVLKSLLVQISPTDPATFAGVVVVLSAAAALGCLLPAKRAMLVDPVVALRNE